MLKKIIMMVISSIALSGCAGGFSQTEREIIGRSGDGIMPLWTTDNSDALPLLRATARQLTPQEVAAPEFAVLKERMLATVQDPDNEGVGIAAPQVGISCALVAVQRVDKEGEPFEFYINPEIVSYSEEKSLGGEGCLSVPDVHGQVWRSDRITVRYNRESDFAVVEEDVEGFAAVIFQHETDHLRGVLFIDYLDDALNSIE